MRQTNAINYGNVVLWVTSLSLLGLADVAKGGFSDVELLWEQYHITGSLGSTDPTLSFDIASSSPVSDRRSDEFNLVYGGGPHYAYANSAAGRFFVSVSTAGWDAPDAYPLYHPQATAEATFQFQPTSSSLVFSSVGSVNTWWSTECGMVLWDMTANERMIEISSDDGGLFGWCLQPYGRVVAGRPYDGPDLTVYPDWLRGDDPYYEGLIVTFDPTHIYQLDMYLSTGADWGECFTGNIAVTLTAIPVPGAVLLGGIGVGLVSWMRRRKTL